MCVSVQVPAERFHSVCEELRQALNREQEAQVLIQEQTNRLRTLQLQVNAHASEETNTQRTLSHTAQVHTRILKVCRKNKIKLRQKINVSAND